MAARFKKRPPGNDNKLLKLEYLKLYDLICTVCQSIYIEPVTLPCNHDFCLSCFNGTIENNALSCPLCRTRIGSWLRTATKHNNLVNSKLWQFIQEKFPKEVKTKLSGEDLEVSSDKVENIRQISAPGEIRSEYEAEIQKVRNERILSEEKHSKDTEELIRKLQDQEKSEAEARAVKVKEDELLAKQLAAQSQEVCPLSEKYKTIVIEKRPPVGSASSTSNEFYRRLAANNAPAYKTHTLDGYLAKNGGSVNRLLGSGSSESGLRPVGSPELMSTAGRCGRFLKNFLSTKLWGSSVNAKALPKTWEPPYAGPQELSVGAGGVQALRRPEPDTASEDSLALELCYFKPLHPQPVTRLKGKSTRCIPIRPKPPTSIQTEPDCDVEVSKLVIGLEKLKGYSIGQHRQKSAFVCLLSVPVSCIKSLNSSTETLQSTKTNTSNIKRDPSVKTKSRKSINTNADEAHNNNNLDEVYSGRRKKTSSLDKHDCKSKGSKANSVSKKPTESNGGVTPKKSSPKKSKTLSQSCVKLGSTTNSQVLTRSRRSISFGSDLNSLPNGKNASIVKHEAIANGVVSNGNLQENGNHRVLRRNGYDKNKDNAGECKNSHPVTRRKSSLLADGETNGKHEHSNGNTGKHLNGFKPTSPLLNVSDKMAKDKRKHATFTTNGFNSFPQEMADFNPSILEEQRRIEEMIAQEKKDLALAKKLQRQLGGNSFFTGYTVRTAKRQATLKELLPTPKKMKV